MKPHQADLCFDPPRIASSPTSKAAAEEIAASAGTLRALVLQCLKQRGPLTDEEIQQACEMAANTERPRRIELVKAGLVVNSGGTKLTQSGRKAVLWRATP